MFAVCQSVGGCPVSRDHLKMMVSDGVILSAQVFKIILGILSESDAFDGFRVFSSFSTLLVLMTKSSITGCGVPLTLGGG